MPFAPVVKDASNDDANVFCDQVQKYPTQLDAVSLDGSDETLNGSG
jgi:hypothetical protein